tara:strand:- start:291 stop:503 length:213 start_codon:yes stop_codon:yes gene_type:complete
MKEIILKVLEENNSQVDLSSEIERIKIANELEKQLNIYVKSMLEDILCCELTDGACDADENCCGGDCHNE